MTRTLVALLALLQLSACACERPRYVYVTGAIDRWDHNRTKKLHSPALRDGEDFVVPARAYSPYGHSVFPSVTVVSSTITDGLPDVLLVPTFSGAHLPLSGDDQKDLINYLSTGTDARAGAAVPRANGDLLATQQRFASMLAFLGDAKQLCRDRASLVAWADEQKYPHTLYVSDSRYNADAFQSIVAVWSNGFWFVLYQLPDKNGPDCDPYSRLVVVPGEGTGQNYPEKRPS